jgi:hypothetical protein
MVQSAKGYVRAGQSYCLAVSLGDFGYLLHYGPIWAYGYAPSEMIVGDPGGDVRRRASNQFRSSQPIKPPVAPISYARDEPLSLSRSRTRPKELARSEENAEETQEQEPESTCQVKRRRAMQGCNQAEG